MINKKKSKKEKRATRTAQYKRLVERKKENGLVQISMWVPAEFVEAGSNMHRIGIIFAEDGADQTPCAFYRPKDDDKNKYLPLQLTKPDGAIAIEHEVDLFNEQI